MQWDSLWNRARADLRIRTEHGDDDVFLWEHSVRVAQNAQKILTLPEVAAGDPDEGAVIAAALYHEAGWVARVQAGEISRFEILLRPISLTHREQGAVIMSDRVAKVLSPESIARATDAIRALSVREIDTLEARILADADNLDEFGVMALWTTIRRGLLEGKGVKAAIDTWRRRREYHFWDARLKDSFRFAAVREIAEGRLAKLEQAMRQIEEQHLGSDILFSQSGNDSARIDEDQGSSNPRPRSSLDRSVTT